MIELIEQKIKELYGSKASFCTEVLRIDPRDSTKKFKTVQSKIDWLNEFLSPLGLKIQIAPLAQIGQKENDTDADSSLSEPTLCCL